ncbi:MAG: ATP-binding protein [Clostridiales bacterium]|nr:ATP-binding protein [Clostridiales bacterium]
MRKIVFRFFSLIASVTALVTTILMTIVVNSQVSALLQQQIRNEGAFLALALDQGVAASFLKEAGFVLPSGRITLINSDGSVFYDDRADVAGMENHLDRQEVQEALRFGNGTSRRFSVTTGNETFYYAQKLTDNRILRTSITVNIIQATLKEMIPWFVIIALYAIGVSLVLSSYLTKKIVEPINLLNLEDPLGNPAYDELAPLLIRMNNQNSQIEENIGLLRKQQDEFLDITENMQEGLVVLGQKGQVLSINRSASQLFGINADFAREKSLPSLHRSPLLQQAAAAAFDGKPGECSLEIGSNFYQVMVNPVWDGERVKGVVLLLVDMTERRMAEVMRRGFTANVSHELKTPLTAIQGYGELMLSGLTKEEDRQEFLRRIYDEAGHMIALVENIMKLSRLDEWNISRIDESNGEIVDHTGDLNQIVDLYSAARDASVRMADKAADKHVEVEVVGEECLVNGNAVLIDELVVNLIDNGVKYNKAGGKVTVSVDRDGQVAVLTVADDGIGIEEAHLGRIFERFYRVDQSRSRETEGSGLGLAIVKHIVQLHKGEINVESRINTGTKISVRLPLR